MNKIPSSLELANFNPAQAIIDDLDTRVGEHNAVTEKFQALDHYYGLIKEAKTNAKKDLYRRKIKRITKELADLIINNQLEQVVKSTLEKAANDSI